MEKADFNGERIISGSRRPDGTLRKERRIREGYTPQDEQKAYVNRVVLNRKNAPVCPGMDNSELEAVRQAHLKAKDKRTTKVEKPATTKPSENKPAKQKSSSALPPPSAPPAPEEPPAAPLDPEAQLTKQIRAIAKKLTQCETLEARRGGGAALQPEESSKLEKKSAWEAELADLEAQLKALA